MSSGNELQKKRPTIFYGICGEGLGHFSRAAFLIPLLLEKGFDIQIFSFGRVAALCEKRFPQCKTHHIPGFRMAYRANTVNIMKTMFLNADFFLRGMVSAFSVTKIVKETNPVLAISDYEPIVAWSAFFSKIPLVTLDHQQIFTECATVSGNSKLFRKLLLFFSNKINYLKPEKRIVTSFFHAPPHKKRGNSNVKIIAPVLRPEVIRMKPTTGEHILIYQTSRSFDCLAKILDELPGEKRVYGTGKKQSGQAEKPFSEETFLHDLATCRFAIVNGGHTTISECLYFGKPVICFPVVGQYEQEMNAHYVDLLGYGMNYRLTPGELPDFKDFFQKEDTIRKNNLQISGKCGNRELEQILFSQIA